MRLIDADLLEDALDDFIGDVYQVVGKQPTIEEAIPVEWLEKRMKDGWDDTELDVIAIQSLQKMIDRWRNENAGT